MRAEYEMVIAQNIQKQSFPLEENGASRHCSAYLLAILRKHHNRSDELPSSVASISSSVHPAIDLER